MGLIVLHSGHFSKVFKRMMGTSCYCAGEVKPPKKSAYGWSIPRTQSPPVSGEDF